MEETATLPFASSYLLPLSNVKDITILDPRKLYKDLAVTMSLAKAKQTGSSQESSFEYDLQSGQAAIHETPQTHSIATGIASSTASSGTKTEPSSYGSQSTGMPHTKQVTISKNSKLFSASIKLQLAQDVVEFIRHKREAFAANLANLEKFVGPFKPGWKEERVECLEQVWIDEFARDMQDAQAIEGSDHVSKLLMLRVNRSSSAFERGLATPVSMAENTRIIQDGDDNDDENGDVLLTEKRSMDQLTPKTPPTPKLPVRTSRPSSIQIASSTSP